jgi:hypothetical protein
MTTLANMYKKYYRYCDTSILDAYKSEEDRDCIVCDWYYTCEEEDKIEQRREEEYYKSLKIHDYETVDQIMCGIGMKHNHDYYRYCKQKKYHFSYDNPNMISQEY